MGGRSAARRARPRLTARAASCPPRRSTGNGKSLGGGSALHCPAAGAAKRSSARGAEALEELRHGVAEVRLDAGRRGLAIAALEGVDDLGVLGDGAPDVALQGHIRELVAQQPALERTQRAEQLLVVAVAHELVVEAEVV